MNDKERIIISKERIRDFGEVYTPEKERLDMIDLAKISINNLDSRILEPACGNGNFLYEILKKRLDLIVKTYKKNKYYFERSSFLAVSSIYGIDIINDNTKKCRERLLKLFNSYHSKFSKAEPNNKLTNVISYLLEKNIIHGNALTLKTIAKDPGSIIFSQWSFVDESNIKRKDFIFSELINPKSFLEPVLISDSGEEVFIPRPIKEHAIQNFLEVNNEQ